MTHRSDYEYRLTDDGQVVVVIDRNLGNLSVTNDAEGVIWDLVEAGHAVDEMRVIYRDSMGQWDRLATQGGRFSGFLPLLPRGLDEAGAIAAARRMAQ